jgi:hypothetical protein
MTEKSHAPVLKLFLVTGIWRPLYRKTYKICKYTGSAIDFGGSVNSNIKEKVKKKNLEEYTLYLETKKQRTNNWCDTSRFRNYKNRNIYYCDNTYKTNFRNLSFSLITKHGIYTTYVTS